MSVFFCNYSMEDGVIQFGVRQCFEVCLRGILSHALLGGDLPDRLRDVLAGWSWSFV